MELQTLQEIEKKYKELKKKYKALEAKKTISRPAVAVAKTADPAEIKKLEKKVYSLLISVRTLTEELVILALLRIV